MQNDVIKLALSILAADFARLGEQVAEDERAGADRIHADVMDGHFVPNGGIDEATAPMAIAPGANLLVAGTSVFGTDKSVAAAMESLRDAVTQVAH